MNRQSGFRNPVHDSPDLIRCLDFFSGSNIQTLLRVEQMHLGTGNIYFRSSFHQVFYLLRIFRTSPIIINIQKNIIRKYLIGSFESFKCIIPRHYPIITFTESGTRNHYPFGKILCTLIDNIPTTDTVPIIFSDLHNPFFK